MTSVLNVGVMPSNPVGNQIRNLQSQLEAERKDKQVLMLALETKAPEVFAEYMRLKDEEAAAREAVLRASQPQPPPQTRYSATTPASGFGGRR